MLIHATLASHMAAIGIPTGTAPARGLITATSPAPPLTLR